jgi:MoaA/NifB/PqqE/SkfB family radical SAM enzyme
MGQENVYSSLKVFRHLNRVNDFIAGHGMPVYLYLYPTNWCNYACGFCSGQYCSFKGTADLDYERLRDFLLAAKDDGLKAVKVSGGEPSIYPRFCDLMPFLSGNFDTGLVTNGSQLLFEQALEAVYGLTWLRISINAATPDTYAQVHGIVKVPGILDSLGEAVGKIRTNSSRTIVGLSFVITDQNAYEIVLAAQLAKSWGVDNIHFTPERTPSGIKVRDTSWTLNALEKAAELATEEFRVFISKERFDLTRQRPKICYYEGLTCAITADGAIYACCDLRGYPEARIGSIHDTSLREAFRNRRPIEISEMCPSCWNDDKNRLLNAVYHEQVHENFV